MSRTSSTQRAIIMQCIVRGVSHGFTNGFEVFAISDRTAVVTTPDGSTYRITVTKTKERDA